MSIPIENSPESSSEQSMTTEPAGASGETSDEQLVPDSRAGFTSAQRVEHGLQAAPGNGTRRIFHEESRGPESNQRTAGK